jgi:hypothetical protein
MADVSLSIVNTAVLKAVGSLQPISATELTLENAGLDQQFELLIKSITLNGAMGIIPVAGQNIKLEVKKAPSEVTLIYNWAGPVWAKTYSAITNKNGVATFLVRIDNIAGTISLFASAPGTLDNVNTLQLDVKSTFIDNSSHVDSLCYVNGDEQAALAVATLTAKDRFPRELKVRAWDSSKKEVKNAQVKFEVVGETNTKIQGNPTPYTWNDGIALTALAPGNQAGVFQVIAKSNGKTLTFSNLALLPESLRIAVYESNSEIKNSFEFSHNDRKRFEIKVVDDKGKPWPYVELKAEILSTQSNAPPIRFASTPREPSIPIKTGASGSAYLDILASDDMPSERLTGYLLIEASVPSDGPAGIKIFIEKTIN